MTENFFIDRIDHLTTPPVPLDENLVQSARTTGQELQRLMLAAASEATKLEELISQALTADASKEQIVARFGLSPDLVDHVIAGNSVMAAFLERLP